MRTRYRASLLLLFGLLSLFFQQCTRDLPAPAPRPASVNLDAAATPALKKRAQQELATSALAGKIASGELAVVLTKAPVTTSATDSAGGQPLANKLIQQTVCCNYYYVYYTNGVQTGQDFAFRDCSTVTWDDGSGGGTGDGGTGGGGSDGEGAIPGLSPNMVVALPPDRPVNDIQQYLKCLSTTQGATMTVYVEQPHARHPDPYVITNAGVNVGHTFISITQGGITRVLGFYPTSSKAVVDDGPGIIGDNAQHAYHVSITTPISSAALGNLLGYVYMHSGDTYSLDDYNCTDFAIGAAAAAGLNLPATYGSWGIGGGRNPGTLGQEMRTLPLPAGASRNVTGGTGRANAGGC